MKNIAIKGSQDPVEQFEIIEILKSWGGINSNGYIGNSDGYYLIDSNNKIVLKSWTYPQDCKLLTLKEYKEKYMNKENNKELQIIAPEGYEVDKENSTFEKIVFKKIEKKLTYEDIAEKLFTDKKHYYTNTCGTVQETTCKTKNTVCFIDPNNAPTYNQLARLLALNKLMNVAYYLNDGWEPDWNNILQGKAFIYYNNPDKELQTFTDGGLNCGKVYFKSKELAEHAIKILGEETIKLALGVC